MRQIGVHAVKVVLSVVVGLVVKPAWADTVTPFYSGRTVSIVVGHEVGTGFDIYARVLARHIGRHIPGNPSVVVQNMVGASGVTAANWLYGAAPKDGSVLATFVPTAAFEPLFGNNAARFDPTRFNWIGNMEESAATCGVSRASGITTFEELRAKETVFGATGATGPFTKFALAVKNLLGAKIKLVQGYKGSASLKIALQRGEVHGACAVPVSTLLSFWKDDLDSGAFRPLLQLSGKRHPVLAGVPHVNDYIRTEEDRQVFGLIFGSQEFGRPFLAPPGVPAERTRALRAAFMATMSDRDFLTDAARTQIDVSPASGEDVEALVARLSASSPAVVERTLQALRKE